MDSFSHKHGQSTYHFVLVTKCRYKMFSKRGHKYLCRDVLTQIALRHSIQIHSLAVSDDHIHLVATIPPTMSVSKAFQLLKGASSYTFFRSIPNFRHRYPRGHFWGGGTFRSVGDVDYDTVQSYVERQDQLDLSDFMPQEFPAL